MPKCRTTINPLTELDVSDREYADLNAAGLLLDTQATTPAGILRAAERQSAEREAPTAVNSGEDEVPTAGDQTTVTGNDNPEGK